MYAAAVRRPAADDGCGILGSDPLRREVLAPGEQQSSIEDPDVDSPSSLGYLAGPTQRSDGNVDCVLIPGVEPVGEVGDRNEVGVGWDVDDRIHRCLLHKWKSANGGQLTLLGSNGQ